MADEKPPQSKYDCLKDALGDMGIKDVLPPIKPGTVVHEVQSRDETALYRYDTPDGVATVQGTNETKPYEGNHTTYTVLSVGSYTRDDAPRKHSTVEVTIDH